MLRIGLTGGIGSGKSTVAALFARRGVPVIDTDEIAHTLTRPGTEAVAEIAAAFGADILTPEGAIDRRRLAARVFADSTERQRLEAILHPRIRAETERRLRALNTPYVLVVVPLLIEAGFTDLVDRVLVVDCEEQTAIRRAAARSHRSEDEIRAIARAQLDRATRLARADDVIVNDAGLDRLDEQVEAYHRRYSAMAASAQG